MTENIMTDEVNKEMTTQAENRTIIVAAHTYDPKHYGVAKYDNEASWNVPGDMAPNGVSAYRWLRETSPDRSQLSALAIWLVDNCPRCVAGKMPAFNRDDRVRCFNGKTVAEQNKWSKEMCFSYGSMADQPAEINDYLFPIIDAHQSDEEYWNAVAEGMRLRGITRVQIGSKEFCL